MTNGEIIYEAKQLVERIKLRYPNFVGKTVRESDIAKLEKALSIKLPEWYFELYTNVPLIDA